MCGGRGRRLARGEKPLLSIGGRPMVSRVLDALADSRIETTRAAVSPHAPRTRALLRTRSDVRVVETPGEGYVADLDRALSGRDRPVLTVAADLPLLDGPTVDCALAARPAGATAVCVPAALKRRLGVSADTTFERDGRELAPAGLNVVADSEDSIMTLDSHRLAVNVNRPRDAQIAEALCD